jgi:dTDP-4-dehydrorhamnose reductase
MTPHRQPPARAGQPAAPGRWLVTGAGGRLGRDLVGVLTAAGATVTAADRRSVDITDRAAAKAAVAGHDIVVNTAAWTDVDGAERNEPAATLANGVGPANLAEACAATGACLIHLSTNYVFSGAADRPYREDATAAPLNAYGRSKLAGEQAIGRIAPECGYVVRTAWLYGAYGTSFVATMLRLAAERERLVVVDDQVGQPTWSWQLAGQLVRLGAAALAGAAPPGIYHGTASGQTTWFGLARAVFAEAGLDPERISPTTSDHTDRLARRPGYGVLGHDRWLRAGLEPLPDWRAALAAALPAIMAGVGR